MSALFTNAWRNSTEKETNLGKKQSQAWKEQNPDDIISPPGSSCA